MKLPCEMVQDLLPLYHDGVCSAVSRSLVQEHLADCEECARVLKSIDAEIEVPRLEADAAKPLVSIQRSWKKQARKTKIKYLCASVAAFLLLVTGWWALTQWCIVPLKAEDYIIKEAAQLENGMIHIEYTLMYDKAEPEMKITEDGVLCDLRRRPILAARREQIPSGSCGVYLDPEDLTWFDEGAYNAFCLGDPDSGESILVWEVGMALPAASANTEEEFRDLEDAYAAANAPEKPDTLRVTHLEPTSEPGGSCGGNVQETVVGGTEATEE